MDGIPVKISEKYKPPRKFILPGCVLNRINSDIKIEPYSFDLERSVLAQLTNLKEAKKRHHEKKLLKRDEWLAKAKVKDAPIEDDSYTLDPCNHATTEESTMLTPVPISSNSRVEPTRNIGQINLSDFENDTSSPFDNVELKTINEMEELAHVLGGTSIKNSSYHALKNHSSNNIHLPNGCTSHQWSTSPGTTYSYPGLYGTTSNSGTGAAITLPSPHIAAPGPYSYMHSSNNTLYSNPVYSSTSSRNMSHSYNTTMGRDDYADNIHNMVQNTYMVHAAQSSLVTPLSSNPQATHTTYTSSVNSNIDKSYNSYLPNYIPTSNTAVNSHLTPTTSSSLTKDPSHTAHPSHLANKEDDDGVSEILDNLKYQVLLRKHQLLPKPPSSNQTESTKPSTSKHSDLPQVNPLSQLSLQLQDFAKNLAEMGFPLARVTRATQHFGADEAKVIEFLLQVQSLEERNYPEKQIEKALLLHNFKEDEAASYLENLNQIMKLGFKEEEVELALSKSSNNRDKALDILIS